MSDSAGCWAGHEYGSAVIYLLDASIFVFRGWFALPDSLTTPDGKPANAFRGFAATLANLLPQLDGAPLIACFDESLTHSFRNHIDPDYKANRTLPPPELEAQFQWCRSLCRALGLSELASKQLEADDLMASLARQARQTNQSITLITRDKDLAQLMRPGDYFWAGPGEARLDYAAMEKKLGFPPERMADWLALTGDPVDNIPGVTGIGAKTASRLLSTFADLEALYAGLDTLATLKLRGAPSIRAKLEAGRETAFHARRLTRLREDGRLPFEHLPQDPCPINLSALSDLHTRVGLGQSTWTKLSAHAETRPCPSP